MTGASRAWRLAAIVAALAALFGTACDGPNDDDDVTGDDDDSVASLDPEIVISDAVGTVVTVRWQTDEPTAGRVTWWTPGDAPRTRESDGEGTEHEVLLLGNVAATTYELEVVASRDGTEVARYDGEITTGPLPAELQGVDLSVSVPLEDGTYGGYLYLAVVTETDVAAVLDRQGNPVWWHADDDPDVRDKRILSVMPSCDGRSILYNRYRIPGDDGRSYYIRVSLDGEDVERIDATGHSHTFVELSDGTVAGIFDDVRQVEDEMVYGDQLVELLPGGETRIVWSTWDQFVYEPGSPTPGTGWTHSNSLEYDPDEDAYYLGVRNLHTIVKLDRASGESHWLLGGDDSDFEFVDGQASLFREQHEFELVDGGVLLFDNGPVQRYESRALELSLDVPGGSADQIWSYSADPPLYSPAGGDVWRLDNGNTIVTWGFAGQIDEVTPDGELAWQLNATLGVGFFYSVWQEEPYTTRLLACGTE